MGWLIALGILVLLAILPLGASIRYNDAGLVLKIIAGPVKLQILPGKKKDPQEKKEKKPAAKKEKKKKEKKPEQKKDAPKEKGGKLTDFLPLVKIGLDLLDGFRRKIRINRLEMKLILAGGDPYDLAMNYGKAWAALGNLWPQLERCFVIKKRDVEVEADFEASQTLIIARADVTITLGRLLGLVFCHGFRALITFLKIQTKRKGGADK